VDSLVGKGSQFVLASSVGSPKAAGRNLNCPQGTEKGFWLWMTEAGFERLPKQRWKHIKSPHCQ